MTTFRELAGNHADYERALMNRSLANLERELAIAGRLNLATLLVGLLLAALASIALIRNVRQRAEAAPNWNGNTRNSRRSTEPRRGS